MGKPRVIWNKNMEVFVLDLWSEKFNELQASKKNGHIYSDMITAFYQKFGTKKISKWDLQVKIHNLTQRYRQERKLVLASGIEISNWPYYERVHKLFIKDHKKSKDINSLDSNNLSYINEINEKDDFHTDESYDEIIVDEIKNKSPSVSPEPKYELSSLSPEELTIKSPRTIKQYKNLSIFNKLNSMEHSHQIDQIENSYNQNTEIKNHEKPYEQFGKYVASELRQLPKRQAILLQQELQNSIIRVKLSCLEFFQLNNSGNRKVQNNIRSPSTSSSCFNTNQSTTLDDDSNTCIDLNFQNRPFNQELSDKFLDNEK